jgi:2-polyprenyl-6-methoxyphenol hydroxylase-like FAD-dependent oxidoreductase
VTDENDPTTWTFVVGGIWKGKIEDYAENEVRLAAYRKSGANFCEPYRSVSSWVPDGTPVSISTMNYWATMPWDNRNGRATLMGDAAHPMTPS